MARLAARRASPRFHRCRALCAALLALAATQARAQDEGAMPAPPPAQVGGGFGIPNPSTLFGGQPGAYAGLGVGQLGSGDWWAQMTVNTSFTLGPVSLGLALPVDLLLYNDDSSGCSTPPCSRDDKAYWGVLRKRDWDEIGDYARFIRYIQYGHKRGDGFYGLFGQEWDSSIGHGTIVSHYNNTLLLDHPKAGLAVDYNGTFFGVETLTDEVVSPTLLAGRAYWRPFGGTPILRGWAIGASYAVDISAPRSLLTVAGPNGVALAQDVNGDPIVATSAAQSVFGIDTEYVLLNNSLIQLIPYIDLNQIPGGGNGAHLGVMGQIVLPIPIIDIRLDAKLEYRIMQAGYIPEYFNQEYDLSRLQYARLGPNGLTYEPQAQAVRDLKNDPTTGNQGYYGELGFNFAGWVQVGGTLEDYQTDDGASLGLYATIPKITFIKVQGYYLRRNASGLTDLFTLDNRSLLGGSLAYNIFGPIYIRLDYQRTWVIVPGSSQVQANATYNIGLATSFSF